MSPTYEVAQHQQVSTRIVEAVAEQEGVDPLTLTPPLYEIIDPEALEALFAPTTGVDRRGQVAFTYRGYQITVSADTKQKVSVEESVRPEPEQELTPEIELDG